MGSMKRTKVSDLKAHLSEYLAEVRAGGSLVVCDRTTPIARVLPYDEQDTLQIREPARPLADLAAVTGVKPRKPIDLVALLRGDRDQR